MSETPAQYRVHNLLPHEADRATLEPGKHTITTRNLEEVLHEIADLERKIVPFLNKLRALQDKPPVIVPKR